MANQYVNKIVVGGITKLDLTGDTISAADLLSGKTAHDKTGAPIEGSCTYDSDTSDANALAAEILNTKTAYVAGQKVTGSMPNRGKATGTISTKSGTYTIQQGYHDGSGTVAISATEQAKIVATNIREGITILGVQGSMKGTEGEKRQTKSVTPTFAEQVVTPDSSSGYTCLSQVTVAAIPVTEVDNAQGGKTLTVG